MPVKQQRNYSHFQLPKLLGSCEIHREINISGSVNLPGPPLLSKMPPADHLVTAAYTLYVYKVKFFCARTCVCVCGYIGH